MALIMGYVKDLDIVVPLRKEISWRDPRTGETFHGWTILLERVEETMWPKLLADMRKRFPDAPADDAAFKAALLAQGGLPIRTERVDVVYDIRGFL